MIDTVLKDYRNLIEKRADELYPKTLAEQFKVISAARYSFFKGGKRIRPAIVLEFCRLCGGKAEDALDFAVALEMIHTYSLIHDDLPCMDDDDMRRGAPSCHKQFGEDIALLAGDTLLTEAFSVISGANTSADKKIKAVALLAQNAGVGGMIGGQELDLSFEHTLPSIEALTDMYAKKTSALLICAASMGITAAGCDTPEYLRYAREYGKLLGLAFQVIDDILDVTADEKLLGKPVGSDSKNGKTTFVTLYGIERSREIADELTEKALAVLDCFDGDTARLKELTGYLLDRKY